jgi:hypothetical protein
MIDSTQLQLRIIVEKAVRPVRASMSRKRKMREELLAHVSAVFEEEAARLDNEQAALERTAQRFGNPAELTGQLQASVPTSDFLQRFLEGMAFRLAVLTFILCAVLLLLAFFLQGRMSEWPFIFYFPTLMFCFLFLVEWMRRGLTATGRLWRRCIIAAATSWFLIPCATFGLLLTLSGDVRSSLTDVLSLLPMSPLAPVVFLLLGYGFTVEFRRRRASGASLVSTSG